MTTYYTPEEVADILKVRKHTVWNWLREGTLKGTKINGKIWRITDKDLEAFINKEESEV
ncbi:MAG: helix-turn-helix domain-containing protein [Clostridiales bacterium]|nr:helix-turn-helix domain-containing protein [Clostridiales bacterium]